MVVVDRALVKHVATLARLELTEDELRLYESQLGSILGYVTQLVDLPVPANALAAGDAPHVVDRADVLVPPLPAALALREAPSAADDFFQVPKIIE